MPWACWRATRAAAVTGRHHRTCWPSDQPWLGHRSAAGGPGRWRRPARAAPGTRCRHERPPRSGPVGARELDLTVGPLIDPTQADNLVELFKEITDLGTIEPLDGGQAADGMRRFKVTTTPDSDLLDLFTFHVRASGGGRAAAPGLRLPRGAPAPWPRRLAAAPSTPATASSTTPGRARRPAGARAMPARGRPPPAPPRPARRRAAPQRREGRRPRSSPATLRVSVEKVDQLINLVGELVITQAMLAQNSKTSTAASTSSWPSGLADLERNTRDLREAVMSIRMIPMSMVFNRFRACCATWRPSSARRSSWSPQGEATELDKGMVEKITDPLTHLVRNSCDHGIEAPAERVATASPSTAPSPWWPAPGRQHRHRGARRRQGPEPRQAAGQAREKGMDAPDTMSDAEVWALIFAPGFSTAEVVTDVSGRGVGMDVVKKNITALGGTVEIDSPRATA